MASETTRKTPSKIDAPTRPRHQRLADVKVVESVGCIAIAEF